MDEFVVKALSELCEKDSEYYHQIFENKISAMIRNDESEQEYKNTKKAIERIKSAIAAQVRNLREAGDSLKGYIQDDINELTAELAKREAELKRMEDAQSENQYVLHELGNMKKRLLSFEEFAKDAQPETLVTLIGSVVDRIYVTTENDTRVCQIFIKGCATEDYSDVFGAADYIENNDIVAVTAILPPMCDLDYYSFLNVTFDNVGFENLPAQVLTEEQLNLFATYMATLGNREDLFPDSVYVTG